LLLLAAISAMSLFSFLMPSAEPRKESRRRPPGIMSELAERDYPKMTAGLILVGPREQAADAVLATDSVLAAPR